MIARWLRRLRRSVVIRWLRCSVILAVLSLISTECVMWALTGRSQFYGWTGPGALLAWYACASLALGAVLLHVKLRAP